jgi:hypothetical protein
MATEKPVGAKQLGDADLTAMRRAAAQVEANLRTISEIASRNLGYEGGSNRPEKSESDKELFIFMPGSSKQIHYNPPDGPCYVMLDPPGVTRPCDDAEGSMSHGFAELMMKMKPE